MESILRGLQQQMEEVRSQEEALRRLQEQAGSESLERSSLASSPIRPLQLADATCNLQLGPDRLRRGARHTEELHRRFRVFVKHEETFTTLLSSKPADSWR